jgi:hypothetical protein
MKLSTNIPDVLYQQIETLANKQNIPVEQLVKIGRAHV